MHEVMNRCYHKSVGIVVRLQRRCVREQGIAYLWSRFIAHDHFARDLAVLELPTSPEQRIT